MDQPTEPVRHVAITHFHVVPLHVIFQITLALLVLKGCNDLKRTEPKPAISAPVNNVSEPVNNVSEPVNNVSEPVNNVSERLQ